MSTVLLYVELPESLPEEKIVELNLKWLKKVNVVYVHNNKDLGFGESEKETD
jgi:hypothetical protein